MLRPILPCSFRSSHGMVQVTVKVRIVKTPLRTLNVGYAGVACCTQKCRFVERDQSLGSCGSMCQQVLITGARTATLLQRLPYLPSADAYVAENGGRIFYPDQTLPTALPLMEDTKWRKTHNPAGVCNKS